MWASPFPRSATSKCNSITELALTIVTTEDEQDLRQFTFAIHNKKISNIQILCFSIRESRIKRVK